MRDDGHFQRDKEVIRIWLRAGGEAQYCRSTSWKSFKGRTAKSGKFGSGSSTECFPKKTSEAFCSDPTIPAAGRWHVETATSSANETDMILKLTGDGHFAGGAIEDDDILFHGSCARKGIKFQVSLAELHSAYKRTPAVVIDRKEAAEAAGQAAASVFDWKRRQPWRSEFYGVGSSAHKCVVM